MKRSEKRIVWLFGNPDLAIDAIPVQLKDRLAAAFPSITFVHKDPLDEWDDAPDPLILIDTVKGIDRVTLFNSLDQFTHSPTVTMHDYDLGMQLAFLQKLGKLPRLTIIGVPPQLTPDVAFTQISDALHRV